ncbi:MAG: class I SAM-dependent methyltransferase [Verrucomicrobia bacterium]|nr:class I SAM-dependent methyltransferase [Verrucomicrobiota bacterium]
MKQPVVSEYQAGLACPLCRAEKSHKLVATVWKAPEASVYQCASCRIVYLHPIMTPEEERLFYEADFTRYMAGRGQEGQRNAEDNFAKNRGEAERRHDQLRPWLRKESRVLEIGSATGFLLEALRREGASVTGVEPGPEYRAYACERGLQTYASMAEVSLETFDLILAYYVLEHLRDPVGYLKDLRRRLAPGGAVALEVPNVEDALAWFYQLAAFDRFYWQKAHYFYYSRMTLRAVLERAGFARVSIFPVQRYDFSNHLHWLLKGEPGGKGKYSDIFDEKLDREYSECLKRHWLCDTLFAIAHAD